MDVWGRDISRSRDVVQYGADNLSIIVADEDCGLGIFPPYIRTVVKNPMIDFAGGRGLLSMQGGWRARRPSGDAENKECGPSHINNLGQVSNEDATKR